jgi:SAM-dependent methyltransferase
MRENDETFRSIGSQNLNVLRKYGFSKNSILLDIGSGYGRLAYAILENMKDFQGKYVGIDILPRHIKWCQEAISSFDSNFVFNHMDIQNDRYNPGGNLKAEEANFNLTNSAYDVCSLFSVFTHMHENEIEIYLNKIYKRLKAGGTCVATFFLLHPERVEKLLNSSGGLTMDYQLNDYTRYHNPDDMLHAISFDEEHIIELTEKFGFVLTSVTYGCWSGEKSEHYQDIVVLEKA